MDTHAIRIKSNSKSLKERFPDIYREFFSQCSLVTSAPGSFWWAGDHGVLHGALAIIQKLPMRTYVGFELTEDKKVYLSDYKVYVSSDGEFKSMAVAEPSASFIVHFLEHWLKKNNCKKGLVVHVLSELPIRSGLNASGSFSAALALGLHLLAELIVPEEIKKWKTVRTEELIRHKKHKFNDVFRTARQLNFMFHSSIHSGASSFAPFLDTPYPIIYFINKRPESLDKDSLAKTKKDKFMTETPKRIFERNEKIIDNSSFFALKMEELFHELETCPPWPIDFGLIYTGTIRLTAHVHQSIAQNKKTLKETASFIQKEFKKYLTDNKLDLIPPFYELVSQKQSGEKLWERYTHPLITVSLETFRAFKGLFQMGLSEIWLRAFFESMNKNYDILKVIGLSNPVIDYACSFLKKEAKKLGTGFGIALKTTGAGKGGDILFAAASRDLYYSIDDFINRLEKETSQTIHLDYASWLDGIGSEGIKIEQSLIHKINSDFISQGSVFVKSLNSSNTLKSHLYTLDEFEKEKPEIDLLIDPFEKAIYVRGKKLTSKELHSTRATINLLKIFLNNIGKEISNRDLPVSSYRADRNEFQSKIISPLKKAILKHVKKKINFSLRGGIVDFRIKLEPGDLTIFYVEKTF